MAFPIYDPVCVMLEKRFSKWNYMDQKDFLTSEKPQPKLDVNKEVKWKARTCVRKFQISWYSQFQWLCGSYYIKKIFCLPCLIISRRKTVWNSGGFGDFANVSRSLKIHESSAEHLRSALGFKRLDGNVGTIQEAIRENSRLYIKQFNENVHLNRRFMQLPILSVLFLGKQELSFRGRLDGESSNNRENFKELLETLVSVSPVDLQTHYKKVAPIFSANSKTIQNELIDCIAEYIDEHVDNELRMCDFFSVQVDDFTDICQKPQCSIIIRYVTDGILKERFLGFLDIPSDRVDALFNLILGVLEKYDYKKKLIGQCWDGASVPTRHLNGLQAKIKEVLPQAVFVHGLAQSVNLVLEQSCKSISNCRIFFATISGLCDFLYHSARRTADTTRWTSNSKMLTVIDSEWVSLKELFNQIITDPSSDQNSARHSKEFLKEFNDFEFSLLAVIFNVVFTQMETDVLFDVLQNKSLDIDYCLSQLINTQKILRSRRNEFEFVKLFELAELRTSLPTDHAGVSLTKNQVFDKYKAIYFEILDTVITQITTRFGDIKKITFVALMDTSKFSSFSANFPADALQNLKDSYPNVFADIQLQRLKSELQLIYTNEDYKRTDLHNFTKLVSADRDIFKEAYKLFSLILTIPSTSVSVERNFSYLKRIKSYLRNTMSEERPTNFLRISIEKELLNELLASEPFYDDIINKFAGLRDRRIDLQFKQLPCKVKVRFTKNGYDLMTALKLPGSVPLCRQELGNKQVKHKGTDCR